MSLSADESESKRGLSEQYEQAEQRVDKLIQAGFSFSGHERNCAYLNMGGRQFANVSTISGLDLADEHSPLE